MFVVVVPICGADDDDVGCKGGGSGDVCSRWWCSGALGGYLPGSGIVVAGGGGRWWQMVTVDGASGGGSRGNGR